MSGNSKDSVPWGRLLGALGSIAVPMLPVFLGSVLYKREVLVDFGAFGANTALYVLAMVLFLICHEAAHAGASLLLDMEIPRIRLGTGREIAHFRVRGTLVRVGMLPLYGLTLVLPRTEGWLRLRVWLVIAAGPAFNMAVCLAMLPWLERTGSGWPSVTLTERFDLPQVILAANLTLFLFNMFPAKTRFGRTDGLKLLTIPFAKRESNASLAEAHQLLRGAEDLDEERFIEALGRADRGLREFPESLGLRNLRALALASLDRRDEALREYRELLGRDGLSTSERALLQNNVAWFVLMSDDREKDLAVIGHYSARAIEEYPGEPGVCLTRGAVLVFEGGRVEEAIELLTNARELGEDLETRAACAAWLALAHARVSRATDSRENLAASRAMDPEGESLAIVESLLTAMGGE